MKPIFLLLLCLIASVFNALVHSAVAAPVIRTAAGANAAAIQPTVDQFRTDLGGINNGVGGTFSSGRREINWDDVPDSLAAPNFLPPDYYNVTSRRGVVFNTLEIATGGGLNDFMVSADSSNPTSTPVEFGNLDPSYPATFTTFSSQRLFAARNTHAMEVFFFVPGTKVPATVNGFGAVFTDVDTSTASGGRAALIRCYAPDGTQLVAFTTLPANNGLSFGGVFMNAGERIARCMIQCGNTFLASGNADNPPDVDVVAMDDFIYGEPQPLHFNVTPTSGSAFPVTVTVPLAFTQVTTSGAPAGFINVTLRCAPHHTYRFLSSTDMINWRPAAIFGAPVGPDQNLFDPRNPGTWSSGTYTGSLSLSQEGHSKLFYIVRDEVTGDVAYGETP